MLKTVKASTDRLKGACYAIVASQYNGEYVEAMLAGAVAALEKSGAQEIKVVRVPGAFEIPVVAAALAAFEEPVYEAVICLGVILRGQTTHAEHIGRGVTEALIELQIRGGVPMIHEVLLLENEDQAKARCLDPKHNRGTEAAQTAIAMAGIMRGLE
jgi:6,7-dimethyl-8-ribityllumazine synthase